MAEILALRQQLAILNRTVKRTSLHFQTWDRYGATTVRSRVRLIGQARSEHLGEITNQIGSCGPTGILDLEEVTVVDVKIVRFLGSCEREGTELLHCPPYF